MQSKINKQIKKILKQEKELTQNFKSGKRICIGKEKRKRWFFSSCGGILELRRGFQASSCVGPGKPKLPFELRGCDIFNLLSELSLSLQGRTTVFKSADTVAAFKARLELWGRQVNTGIFDI